jgi:hypothetical protein
VSNWINRGAPTEECPAIQELTGVRCEVHRPSVDWEQFRRVLCASHRQMLEASDDVQPPVGTIPVRPISNDWRKASKARSDFRWRIACAIALLAPFAAMRRAATVLDMVRPCAKGSNDEKAVPAVSVSVD